MKGSKGQAEIIAVTLLLAAIPLAIYFAAFYVPKPTSFVQTPTAEWKTIEIRPGLDYNTTWQIAVDTVSKEYDIEVMEKASGYFRTGWLYTYVYRGKAIDRYRSQITVKILWDKRVCQVKCEAQWLKLGGAFATSTGWITGYDKALLEKVYTDLQGRLGRVVR